MDSSSLTDKQAQFEEFFMIQHALSINVSLVDKTTPLPDTDDLENNMPLAFKMASELATIEAQALRPLRHLSDHAAELAEYLNHQARKIDLMMSFILQQQDDETLRFKTVKFGGGGVIVAQPTQVSVGDVVELKLFLDQEAAAIFCYGEAISCEQVDSEYHVSYGFTRIREQDQELLVRASLHLQTLQLRKRAQKKSSKED